MRKRKRRWRGLNSPTPLLATRRRVRSLILSSCLTSRGRLGKKRTVGYTRQSRARNRNYLSFVEKLDGTAFACYNNFQEIRKMREKLCPSNLKNIKK